MKIDARADGDRDRTGQVEGKEPEGDHILAAHLRAELGAGRQLPDVAIAGPRGLLPSVYDVSGLAAASVAASWAAIGWARRPASRGSIRAGIDRPGRSAATRRPGGSTDQQQEPGA